MSGWFISRNQRRTAETLVPCTRPQCETSGKRTSGRATRAIVRGHGTHSEPPEEKAVNPRVLSYAFHCAQCLQRRSFHGKSFVRVTCSATCVACVNVLLHEIHRILNPTQPHHNENTVGHNLAMKLAEDGVAEFGT